MADYVSVTTTRQNKYQFMVDFGPEIAGLIADEPVPIGAGTGPSPTHLLAAAVANCLSASLVFALGKFNEDPGPLVATAVCSVERNEKNRLRVQNIAITITLGAAVKSLLHLERALIQFEEFCTVSQSVRNGIPFTVSVKGADGRFLK